MRMDRASGEVGADLAGNRWLRRVLLLWVILFLTVGIKAAVSPRRHTVYPLLVGGARHWWAGQSLYTYDPAVVDNYEVYRYSPTCALAFSPLAPLPDRLGGVLWAFLNLGVLVWGLLRAARDVFPGEWPNRRKAWLLALVLVGAIRPAWNSQGNPLVAGILLLASSAVARRRWWTASALLAIPVFLKLAPIALALLFVAVWPRRLLGRFAMAMAAGAAVPFATRPAALVIAQHREWFASLAHSSVTRWPAFRDAWTLWELTGHPVHVRSYRLIQALAGLLTLAWCLRLRRLAPGERFLLTATLAMGTAYLMVFGPSVEYPTYVVLAPMVAWGVLTAFERRLGRAWAVLAYALTMVIGSEAVAHPLERRFPMALGILPVGSLLFAAWLARHARVLAATSALFPTLSPASGAPRRGAGTDLDLRPRGRDDAPSPRDTHLRWNSKS